MSTNRRSRVAWILGVYGLLLATSCGVRASRETSLALDSGDRVALVGAVAGAKTTSGQVRIVYRDYVPATDSGSPPLVLLHGSPGHKEDFRFLGPSFAGKHRAIAVDLPGFGASSESVPDYSFLAHAIYVRELLDQLGIRQAHIVGFSMGGGVAVSFADVAPDRLASLTLLSGLGVQEMELTGNYYANHLVHGAQLAGLWLLREAIPHFGGFDHAMLGVPYARNFYDSDQRPLRAALQRVTAPTLILHGVNDGLVPIDAAIEHHRLVPQSELVTTDDDHFMLFARADLLEERIGEFVDRVNRGQAVTRASADPDRIRASTPVFTDRRFPRVRGIAAAVFGLLLTTGALLSGLVSGAAGGVLAGQGRVSAATATVACALGAIIAQLAFAFRRRPRQPDSTRPVAMAVNVAWVSLAVALSTLIMRLTLGAVAGAAAHVTAIGLATIGAVASVLAIVRRGVTWKGRRLLLSSWRRLTRWEFWPAWVFYPPVFIYIAYLALKHRSVTVFTAANPAIVAGGFVGESKYGILQGLEASRPFVARARLIPGAAAHAEKLRDAQAFMSEESLRFPIVLKPNHGQRGSGVVVVRSSRMLDAALARSSVDTIVQEYVDGPEFGIFYYRHPAATQGHIFSVTEKRLPDVTGDGRRTLEDLILDDDRAVCAARLYCERYADRLSEIPLAGQVIPLAELGTHCRGALFLNGRAVLTPALAARIEAIAERFEGFYFGRFDVRAADGIDAFREGHGFKILELNGVTSEATHIYHPGTPLTVAYRVLLEQWRIAFDIGAENLRRGVAPTPVRQLVALARDYRRSARAHLGDGVTLEA